MCVRVGGGVKRQVISKTNLLVLISSMVKRGAFF